MFFREVSFQGIYNAMKIIIQVIWKHELQWDKNIPSDIAIEWKQLTEELFVKDVEI